ncbi:secretory phospholipase A2 [Thelonectria olida]|uniref:Secretory phospholipase A2 n=1 Tax=Thelonectria olida TaxID=1576542 RepID=A0A9P8VS73_9HYPO|nr:secretory phospholipase A2 [Thelonectria olida]
MKLSLWLFVNLSAVSATSPAADESPSYNIARQDRCTAAEFDRLLFQVDMDTFSRARDARNPPCFDWSSNECSWSPDMPAGFNFIPSCRRHDFGYQNAKREERLTEAMRLRIDDAFKMDLYNECGKFRGVTELLRRMFCMGIADIYYNAVRLCGGGNCFNFE